MFSSLGRVFGSHAFLPPGFLWRANRRLPLTLQVLGK
jgi:hypothetical protein